MKKGLLLTFAALGAAFSTLAQSFSPNNLAVYRYGQTSVPFANGIRTAVFVDEYTPTGTFVRTITIPRVASGANYGFEGLGLTTGGAYENEGYPVLSKDGSTFSVIGYNPDQAGQFVVATVNAAGSVSSTTLINDDIAASPISGSNNIGAPRSAVVEGNAVYFNGYNAGLRYTTVGSTAASTRVSVGQNAPRVLTIAETLFGTTAVAKIFVPNASTSLPNAPLMTGSTTINNPPNIPGGAPVVSAHQALVIKAYDRTFLYLLDDNSGAPSIKKYRSNDSGNDWVTLGNVSVPVNTKSIAGKFDENGVKIYFTTLGTPGSANSTLNVLTDDFTNTNRLSKSITGFTYNTIATAAANTTFRGVTMAPGTSILPVELSKFEGRVVDKFNVLNWSTVSEKNSSHFEILKSGNAKDFKKLDEVKAAGDFDSEKRYSFTDYNPLPGANYYKLNQVDRDGTATTYGPVVVTSKAPKSDFSVNASTIKSTLSLVINSAAAQQAKLKVLNVNGQTLQAYAFDLEKGYNNLSLPASYNKVGMQIAILTTAGEVVTKKFVWQQ